ncbi:MAG: DNA translocase FtsK 4TM domain-containing protein, partial [Acidobacteria bacterium]|nr:DNA translocase FtsK 4TM domain-containing protein [Acidobacteriota bacterium]
MATAVRKKAETRKKHTHTNEVIAVILVALALLVFLCLVSYDVGDPTFNTSSTQKTQNWIGVVGANFAEALMSAVGVISYLLPGLVALMAWRVFRSQDLRVSVGHVIGYVVFVAALSSLAAMFGFHGGVVGVFFQQMFFGLLGKIGTIVLLFAVAVAALILITNLSLGWFFGTFSFAFRNLGVHLAEWRAKRRGRESIAAIAETKELPVPKAKKEAPVILKGDTVPFPTKEVKIRESVAAIFDEPKSEPATVPADDVAPFEPAEIVPPTISGADEPAIDDDAPPFEDLIAESAKIPISPVRQTGDLEAIRIDDGDLEPEEFRPAKKLRNYDG